MTTLREKLEEIRKLDPQPRGKAFEGFLGDVFQNSGLRHKLSYRPKGEEIDGAIWWQLRTLLLEAKWYATPLPASSIYAFKGKVDGKFDGTLGIFISVSGYSKDCIDALSHGKNLNILLFDGDDVEVMADGTSFVAMLEEKLFAAGQTGNLYLPWRDLAGAETVIDATKREHDPQLLIVICEGPMDKIILESLITHIAKKKGKTVDPKFLVSYGKHPLMEALVPSLASLLSKGIDDSAAIITVFDSDTTSISKVEEQRKRVIKNLEDLPSSWQSHVSVAVPEIEEWIGLDSRTSKSNLRTHLQSVDWDKQSQGTPELNLLYIFLESVI